MVYFVATDGKRTSRPPRPAGTPYRSTFGASLPRSRRPGRLRVLLGAVALLLSGLAIGNAAPAGAVPTGTITVVARGIRDPEGIAKGSDGNLWFTNRGNNSIGRMTPAGAATHFGGTGISSPHMITAGPDGNLWFTNQGNASIGRITPAGVVANFTNATLNLPEGITAGPDGNIWFTDSANNVVGRITPAGVIATFSASGIHSPGGIATGSDGNLWFTNDFPASSIGRITPAGAVTTFTDPAMSNPAGIAAGPDGNLWFTDYGNGLIGRVTPAGVVTTFTGTGVSSPEGITAGPDGNVWFTNNGSGSIGRITPAGVMSNFVDPETKHPKGITTGPDGNLWFVNSLYEAIGRVTPAGVFGQFTGNGINNPIGMAKGADGNLWFTNEANATIGRITPAGVVANFNGPGVSRPFGITAGPDGNLWFTNNGSASIGRITPAGVASNFTGLGISGPSGITTGPDGNLWFTNNGNASIGRITPAGVVSNFTGTGISSPFGITAGPDGNLWFTNQGNASIGRITLAGVVTNFTGTGIGLPLNITAGPDGNLWFTNWGNQSIGRISPAGGVANFAGSGIVNPFGITTGPDGNLWFTNQGNASIGRISPAGAVDNFTDAGLASPQGIAVAADGSLWFTSASNASIGRITTAAPPGAPTGATAVAGRANATVTWAAPASDGRSPVTAYTVTSSPDAKTCTWTGGPRTCTVTGLTNGTPYTFSVTATNSVGTGPASAASAAVTPFSGSFFHSLAPVRILDSRGPVGGWNARLVAGAPKTLTVTSGAGVPATADAVIMNVTVTNGTANSFVSAYPAGAAPPTATNLNFAAGQTIPNLVTVKVGAAGQVAFANGAGSVDVIADIVGYFDAVPADRYHAVPPARILDSRGLTGGWNAPLVAGTPKTLTVRGAGGVSGTADAVIMNVTVTSGSANSFLTAYPAGASVPTASNLNFAAGQTIPNLVVVKVGTAGQVAFSNAAGSVHVIADVVGYFDTATGDLFHPVDPARILDSRGAVGGWNAKLDAATPRSVQVTTAGGVPAGATAVIGNTTVTAGTANSYVTVYPTGTPIPTASNVNFAAGETIPNLTAVKIGTGGKISFANAVGAADVIFDVVGYFAAA